MEQKILEIISPLIAKGKIAEVTQVLEKLYFECKKESDREAFQDYLGYPQSKS